MRTAFINKIQTVPMKKRGIGEESKIFNHIFKEMCSVIKNIDPVCSNVEAQFPFWGVNRWQDSGNRTGSCTYKENNTTSEY